MIFMRAIRQPAAFFLFLAMLFSEPRLVSAQATTVKFFPETGHYVRGDFLRFYGSVPDPDLVFGYPITEQITSKDGKAVQYFQRARFELRRDLPESQRVQLTPIGQALYQRAEQLRLENISGCEPFLTGFSVCLAFLDFFKASGGVTQFGNPISPFEFHENLIVQYFENARFEWRADRPEGQRVVLTDLGRQYFDRLGEDPALLRPMSPVDATINPILAIKAHAFVARPLTGPTGQQTIYVIVQSQTLQAVSNATGKATVRWTEGKVEEYFFTSNQAGLGTVTVNFADQKQGELVPIEIVVVYQGLGSTTRTSFRIWY
jgi:hypothetical protein